MIEIKNLVKRYGEKTAVDNISLSISDGEIVGFLGPNGAGKTTTMSMLTGSLSCTSGSITVNGVDVFDDPMEVKKQIGYLPEFPPLYLEMTVKEYLNFIYDLKECTQDRQAHIAEICERVRLDDVFNRVIRNLSKGYRQRVGIAQALIGNPKVIIFDEPTLGLDPKQIIEIRTLIKELGKSHTVILSTHILPEVQMVCDRIVIINKGKIVADELTENIDKVIVGARQIQIKACGPEKEMLAALRSLNGIRYAETVGEREMSSYAMLVESEPGVDMRKTIFGVFARNGWPIIGMEAVGLNLEEIFISVVDESGGDDTRKKQKKGGR